MVDPEEGGGNLEPHFSRNAEHETFDDEMEMKQAVQAYNDYNESMPR